MAKKNTILIKFEAKGHEELIRAINKLAQVQKKLDKSLKKVTKSSLKAAKSAGILDTRNKRLAETNSALALSFATLRSRSYK